MALWCLLDYFIKKAGYINIALRYLLLKVTSERFSKKKVLLDY